MHITDRIRFSFLKNISIFDFFCFYGYCILVFILIGRAMNIRIFGLNQKYNESNQNLRIFCRAFCKIDSKLKVKPKTNPCFSWIFFVLFTPTSS